MIRRPAALLSVVVLTLVATGAEARSTRRPPKPVCNLITDPADDAAGPASQRGTMLSEPALEIVSADIASTAKELTVAIRVKQLKLPPDTAPEGVQWSLGFTVGAERFDFLTSTSRIATNWPYGSVKGSFDTAKNEIRFTVPMSELTKRVGIVNGKTVARTLSANAGHYTTMDRNWGVGNGSFVYTADRAESAATYTFGAASCLRVGQ